MFRLFSLGSLLVFSTLSLVSNIAAQVAIYRVDFKEAPDSSNTEFYQEGYLILPATGGAATIVLTMNRNGEKLYASVPDGGRYFVTQGPGGADDMAAFSSMVNNEGAEAYYLMSGKIDFQIKGTVNRLTFSIPVADSMKGHALAADDEEGLLPAADGSLGFVGMATMEAFLLKERTSAANRRGLTVAEAFAELVALLESNGYEEDTGQVDDGRSPDATGSDTPAVVDDATGTN